MTGAESSNTVRVILIGQTGLDAVLRADPSLWLVNVPDGLEAVAELSEAGRAPSVVVLRPGEGEPDGRLVDALRSVDPGVRVLTVTENGARAPAGVDGVLPRSLAPAGLCARVHEAVRSAPSAAPGPSAPCVGDEAVIEAMLRGRDVSAAALEVLRARAGDPGAVFIGAADLGPGSAAGVPVSIHGATLGRLVCRGEAATVAGHAAWLAGWLRLRDQHEQLRQAAFTDSLTGAHNRRYYDLSMNALLERARRDRQTVSILLLDIDNFKAFNDHHGHEAGDEILRETVRLLGSVIRPGDRVCRIGGDEFVVIFHDTEGPRQPGSKPPKSVFQIAQRFQEQVRRQRFPKLGSQFPGAPERLEVSGGLAVYPWDGASAEALLAHADALLLKGKRSGKNVIRFGPEGEM
ncbi:MAG: GGDEF domain-containing protein [Phycisphaerae bacterium]|nr:GGDEF domain-containing protein [Phycisphaerae bacterium]